MGSRHRLDHRNAHAGESRVLPVGHRPDLHDAIPPAGGHNYQHQCCWFGSARIVVVTCERVMPEQRRRSLSGGGNQAR